MIQYDAFLMHAHAAVVSVEGRGIAFLARSGGGKSTRVCLWKRAFGDRLTIINGDKPMLRFVDNALYVFGTPWNGKEGRGMNGSAPLHALCFLEKSEEVSVSLLKDENVSLTGRNPCNRGFLFWR